MISFSIKGVDATIGDWRWNGFAAATGDSPLAAKRELELAGGARWATDDVVDEEWREVVAPVQHLARRAIEGGLRARRDAVGAMTSGMRGAFRDVRPLPSVAELREDPRDPACRVVLHDVRIEFRWSDGTRLGVRGRDTQPRFQHDHMPPNALAAARFAHRLAWRETAAGLLDGAARVGAHVSTTEQALAEVAAYTW